MAPAYTYRYAGTDQNELVSQTTPSGSYHYVYGRTDKQGLPIIEQVNKDGYTAYVEHDPSRCKGGGGGSRRLDLLGSHGYAGRDRFLL